ncbi:MAG: PAS domain-containing protein [Alphaproteobacteria bacterium]
MLRRVHAFQPIELDPELRFEDRSFDSLMEYWESKRAGAALPSRADIDPLDLPEHLPNLCLIEVHDPPLRMRYRLVGTAIVEQLHRDSTHRWYHELYSADDMAFLESMYRRMMRDRRPLRTFGRSRYADSDYYDFEMLSLPLASDNETVDMVLGKLVFRFSSHQQA